MERVYHVHTKTTIGKNSRFWRAAGSDDLYWLTLESAGQQMLDRMQQKDSCQFLRNHYTLNSRVIHGRQVGGEVYTEDEFGNPQYDFSKINQIYKEFVSRGLKPIVEYDYLPPALSYQLDEHAAKRIEGMSASDLGPKDWGKWADLLKAFTQNLVDTFGLKEVRTWYFEVWNEPDHWPKEDLSTFFRMYDTFVDAVTSVDDQLRVGGPATFSTSFLRDFLHHVAKGKNHITGKTGTRIDFVSHHIYGLSGGWVHEHPLVQPTVQRFVQEVLWIQRLLKQYPELGDVEFHLNEWGVCSNYYRTAAEYPALEYRNSEFSALFFAKLVHLLYAVEDAFQFPTSMLLYWGFSFETSTNEYFRGNRDLLTAGGVPKPIQTAHEMLSLMGDHRLKVTGPKPGGSIGVMATSSENDRIELLAYHFNELQDVPTGTETVRIRLDELGSAQRVKATMYRLDRDHHNTYRAWERLGKPKHVSGETNETVALLKAEGELTADSVIEIAIDGGAAELPLTLPADSLCFVVVEILY
ncbi:MAG: GH39 family glycosyl hydrolase [Bacillota bacterium]